MNRTDILSGDDSNDLLLVFRNFNSTAENEVESVGNIRQQQNKQFLAWDLNEENEMKLKCFAEMQEAFVLCKNVEMQ